jgi:hypothetical protein
MESLETQSLAWDDLLEEDRDFFVNPHPDVFDIDRARRLVEGFNDEDKNQVRTVLVSAIKKNDHDSEALLDDLKTFHLELDRHLGWYDQKKTSGV